MYKNVEKKMHFIKRLMIHLTVESRGAPEGTLESAPNGALKNLHKDAQEGAFEVEFKGTLRVTLGLHLWFHLLMQPLIYAFLQNSSFNSGPDAVLEDALDVGLNVALEGVP